LNQCRLHKTKKHTHGCSAKCGTPWAVTHIRVLHYPPPPTREDEEEEEEEEEEASGEVIGTAVIN
jgi:hypothetical protein